ncbi:hypothetical protein HZI73_22445 [Vallitalea pronyensis]|uniref:Uncharacterized protein n=1 Tax=Vallitalea pronyensis TaxID=1348613 RepID=A0A8J8MN81_9FIRM|nr:hypothetical protein [Vallitalea pronyensis]QUI24890.1 hypothetical protein HZI73_22445 [Vallitalea pronyensis]
MTRIVKYLEQLGHTIRYKESQTWSGKKGWYNDGTFTYDIYTVSKDSISFFIYHKSSGRPRYMMTRNKYDPVLDSEIIAYSQKDFIDYFQLKTNN